MLRFCLLILSFFVLSGLFAQEKKRLADYNVSYETYVSSGSDLPFWLTSNRNGVFSKQNNNYQLIQFGLSEEQKPDSVIKWGYTMGANLVYGYSDKADFQVNQYWMGLRHKGFILKAGAQADPILYGGLSSTNGNLDRSNNARPLPGISFSTDNYIPFLFWQKWFSFKAEYEEKLFTDHSFVRDAHLHHKSLYGKVLLSGNWSVTAGLEHFVLWGGTSPTEGRMPGLSQYFNYILGLKAGPGAFIDDRLNISGNQLGIYSLEVRKELNESCISFYWNHLFEDRSGMEMVNWNDGLWGIHVNKKDKSALITDIVYEYMYTLNQSGSVHHAPAPTPENPGRVTGRGRDNYFNHYIYRSFTYYNRMMGTPLFVPHLGEDGVADGFESTRMWMHHLGMKGCLGSDIYWKGMLTWSRNFGNYKDSYPWTVPYGPSRDELSFLGELRYSGSKLPFQVNIGIAGDYGDLFQKRIGGYTGINYLF